MAMGFLVPEEVLEKTTECAHEYSCLNEDSFPCCEVVAKAATGVLLVFCAKKSSCPYCQDIKTHTGFCVCPLRIKLYEEYGI